MLLCVWSVAVCVLTSPGGPILVRFRPWGSGVSGVRRRRPKRAARKRAGGSGGARSALSGGFSAVGERRKRGMSAARHSREPLRPIYTHAQTGETPQYTQIKQGKQRNITKPTTHKKTPPSQRARTSR